MNKLIKGRNMVSLLFVFLAGVTFIWWVIHSTNNHMQAELLEKARIAAYAINIEDITSLSGSEKDLSNPAYLRIKSQLAVMRNAKQQCRFLYLMGRRSDGTVFFFADSLPEGSKDYASPGLVYKEVSNFYLNVFTNRQEAVVGPVTDRWGRLMTALVPLKIPHTGHLLAVLGMDVDAKDWNKEIIGKAIFPFVIFVLFLCLGITLVARGHAIASLRKSEEKYQTLFGNAQVALFRTSIDGKLVEINERYAQMAGYEKVEDCMAEFNLGDAWAGPDDRDELLKILRDRGYVNDYETKINRRDGSPMWIVFSATIFSEKGYIEGSIVDITGRKQAEKERDKLQARLFQIQKMESIGNLAGGIAHDFNNILSSIIGFTELALDDVKKGTPLEDSLQEVYTAGKRAKELVKQILAFARQSNEERKPIQVDIIAKEVLKLIRSTIPTTIEIKENIESHSLIMGNPSQIHQLLMNLCTNASQAMENTGGILKVRLVDVEHIGPSSLPASKLGSGGYIKLSVSDNGSGISPDVIGSIFEPYFTTKGVGEGTGMGLAMAHGIVESYGGEITVDSELGQGTVFRVYLPIIKGREDHRLYIKEELSSGTERILLVDDELPIAKMGSQALERLGYQVTVRTSSVEALELFRAKPDGFDLVITDMTMPNMTGDELAVQLIALRHDIPVILCTGYSKNISDEKATKIGIKAFTYKPIVKADLAKTVRKVLDACRSEV